MFEIASGVNDISTGVLTSNGAIDALKNGRRYGQYMILSCSDAVRVEKCALTDALFDPRGKMFAERTTTVESGSFTLLSAALSADGITEDVKVTFGEGFVKQAGVPLNVSVTVSLSAKKDCAVLTGGDNPLVRWLLGEDEIKSAYLAFGYSYSPLDNAPLMPDELDNYLRAEMNIDESGIYFTAESLDKFADVLLLVNGKPALRALPAAANAKTAVKETTVPSSEAITMSEAVISVLSVTYGGSPLLSYEVSRSIRNCNSPVKTEFKVGEQSHFVSDLCGNVAAVSDGEATLFRFTGGRLRAIGQMRVNGDKNSVRMTGDGCLFYLSGSSLVRADADGAETVTPLPSGVTDYEIAEDDVGVYIAAFVTAGRIITARLDGTGELSVTGEYPASSLPLVGKLDARRLILGSRNFGAEVIGTGGSASALSVTEAVKSVYSDSSPRRIAASGRLLCFETTSGQLVVLDSVTRSGMQMGNGRLSPSPQAYACGGHIFTVQNSGGIIAVDNPDGEDIESVCRLNECILRLHTDGGIDYLPIVGGAVTLTSDAFGFRGKAVIEYLTPSVNTGAVTVGIRFD